MKVFALATMHLLISAACSFAQLPDNPHGSLPRGMDCGDCHTSQQWRVLRTKTGFDHDKTGFALTGKHAAAGCRACHTSLRFAADAANPRTCGSCHTDVHQGRLGSNCSACHDTRAFSNMANPQAHARTAMPLSGAHARVPCESCHRNERAGSYTALDTRCASCHEVDYARVALPNHAAGNYSRECRQCHTELAWQGASFEHASAANGFALLGAHIRASCGACHATADGRLRFTPTPSSPQECAVCHDPEYRDEHTGSGYPNVCTACHSVDSWDGAVFRHDQPALECVSCHRRDYDGAHSGSNYPTSCRACHASTSTWSNASFTHQRFPLTGAHTTLPCSGCHAPNNDLIYPMPANASDCVACHRSDYDRRHAGSNFSTSCTDCHTNATWSGATFDHGAVARGYVLQGRHAQIPCLSCHAPDGRPLFTPAGSNDCVACHRADFDREHGTSGYPVTCASCHSQNDWISSFNHDAQHFPIFSGEHRGEWTSCQQCHTTPNDFKTFNCLNCHSQTSTNADHRAVNGYVYESIRCYSCHPRGDS